MSAGSTSRATLPGTFSRRGARRAVAKGVHHVERRLQLAQALGPSRSKRRAPASVGTTLRVVRFKRRMPSFASSRRTASLRLEADAPLIRPPLAKAAGAHYRDISLQIVNLRRHCPLLGTACTDYTALSRD